MLSLRPSGEEFALALNDLVVGAGALRSPNRVSVSQGACDNLVIGRPGGSEGAYDIDETPYMREPMDCLGSRFFEAVCFVGPSQSGKTAGLGEGWLCNSVVNDPGDMLIVQMNQGKAREYAKQRIDRAIRHSPKVKALLSADKQDDNTHDKLFKHGMWLRIAWPTVGNLSSTSYRYVFVTDYDRMDDDISGEGDVFGLASARTRTFLSRGKVCVESSPGREIVNPHWKPSSLHEAPHVSGILGIYNRSDRRRWYWKCPHCLSWFEPAPGVGMFNVPKTHELVEIVRTVDVETLVEQYNNLICPTGCVIEPIYKASMNRGGRWIKDGQFLTDEDQLGGEARKSRIAGFWMGGIAVAYQSWAGLLRKHFQAVLDYSLSGSEEALKTTTNTDQGMPYMSQMLMAASETAQSPEERAEASLKRFIVPDNTRFLIAAVDIQGGQKASFVVQVHAFAENFEQTLIDRYSIVWSKRPGMGSDFAPLDPASYQEDWDLLIDKVVRATYATSTSGIELRLRLTVVDTGGEDGVTDKAYAWYRKVRTMGLANRVMLIKGHPSPGAPIIRETLLGGIKGKGDVPVYLLNSDLLKDAVSNGLKRTTPGPGYYHWPAWLQQAFYDELNSEVRLESGAWSQRGRRNEAFDLCAYIRAGALKLGVDKIKDWAAAPPWAQPIVSNSDTMTSDERREMKAREAPVPASPVANSRVTVQHGRRVVRSRYVQNGGQ